MRQERQDFWRYVYLWGVRVEKLAEQPQSRGVAAIELERFNRNDELLERKRASVASATRVLEFIALVDDPDMYQ